MHTDHRSRHEPGSDPRAAAAGPPLSVRVGARTDAGRVREENQDRISRFNSPIGEVFLVVDGMGGHRGGALASEMTVEGMERHLRAADSRTPPEEALREAAARTHREIHQRAGSGQPEMAKMGATAVLALLRGRRARIAHAGDSRAYLLRDSRLSRLTKDHTVVQRMLDHNMLTEEEARQHPDSSVVSRAFGRGSDFELEVAAPFDLVEGDRLLLCSDGLCGYVDDEAIAQAMRADSAQAGADRLVALALDAGGEDNVSVQVLSFLGADEQPAGAFPPAPAPAARAAVPPGSVDAEATAGRQGARGRLHPAALAALILLAVVVGFLLSRFVIVPWLRGERPEGGPAAAPRERAAPPETAAPPPETAAPGADRPADEITPSTGGDRPSAVPDYELHLDFGGNTVRLDVFTPERMPGPNAVEGQRESRLQSGRVHYWPGFDRQARRVAEILALEAVPVEGEQLAAAGVLVIVIPEADDDWPRARIYFQPGFKKEANLLQQSLHCETPPRPLSELRGETGGGPMLVITSTDDGSKEPHDE